MDAAKLAFLGLSILTAALLVALVFWASRNYRVQRLVLAAGARDGESFAMARAMKIVVERHFPRVRIAVVETGGTADNLALLDRGKADLATAQADLEAGAFARLVAVLYEDRFQLLAHRRAGVRRFTDLRGKRIALPQSGGQYRSFLRVAEHFGLTPAAFTFVGDSEQSADAAFIRGAADAAFRVRSAGSPPILALSRGIDVEFIPIAHAAAMHIAVPAYSPSVIPEGAYSGDPPVPSADLPTIAVVDAVSDCGDRRSAGTYRGQVVESVLRELAPRCAGVAVGARSVEGQFIYICCPGYTPCVRKSVSFGAFETAPRLLVEGMPRFALVSLTLACLPLLAQEDDARNRFIGKWEARWKEQLICTIRLELGTPISGETQACSIHVDENGDLQAPDSSERSDEPTPILNARLRGETLTFEEKDGDEVMKFELMLVGERAAELTLPDAPVRIKPISFSRE